MDIGPADKKRQKSKKEELLSRKAGRNSQELQHPQRLSRKQFQKERKRSSNHAKCQKAKDESWMGEKHSYQWR